MTRNGSGGKTVCPRGLSFSQFIVHMSTTNCEKDNPLGGKFTPDGTVCHPGILKAKIFS